MVTPTIDALNPLLLLAVIVAAGAAGAWLARAVRIPAITGHVLAGALLGYFVIPNVNAASELRPLSTFAMGLIAVAVGGHLSYRRIRTALKRIVGIAVMESIMTAVFVSAVVYYFTRSEAIALLMGSIAVATAPATTFALIRETHAKGTFVKTLLSVVALDNIFCVMLFSFVLAIVGDVVEDAGGNVQIGMAFIHAGQQFAGALILGCLAGVFVELATIRIRGNDFGIVCAAILVCTGGPTLLNLNPLLTSLFLGVYLGNRSARTERQLNTLAVLESPLYLCFFTLAGTALHVESLAEAGPLVGAYLIARAAGKSIGAMIGGRLLQVSDRIYTNVAIGLWPQAGVAIGLVVLLESDVRLQQTMAPLIGTVILSAVTVNEIFGPFFTRGALHRSREAGRDRPRLVEFLEEEHILMDIQADDQWDALRQMSSFYAQVYRCTPSEAAAIESSVLEREREMTTAIGLGAAIPHGRISKGEGIKGVLGISREGIDFGAADGHPVHLMMLIVTPSDHDQRHLEVMSGLVSMVSNEVVRERLAAAIDANDAWEIIEGEESRPYNYFLEEQEDEPAQ
jgi:mannitol/fructose-specific phosphotransferase system IIA component (Ntr-type)/Kef-type K+ transport system membrane component KefB